ncbi:MAG: glycosyltransferase family 2 protein [Planctomycetota bacterium]
MAGRLHSLDVVFTTLNEEINLPHTLPAALEVADRVVVVDSGSTDDTKGVVEASGAEFVHQDWLGYAAQKNWAIDELGLTGDWTLIVDADEKIMPDLAAFLGELRSRPIDEVPESAFQINRYFIFLTKQIRHCGYYPSWNIRLFKRGRARYEQRDVHEHMVVDGATGYAPGHLEHYDRRGLTYWNFKHNQYAVAEAIEAYRVMQHASRAENKEARLFGDHAQRVRWIKTRLYPSLPGKSFARFLYAYVLRLGFMDGLVGVRFCLFLAAYELMIDLNLRELRLGVHPRQAEVEATSVPEREAAS